MRKYICQPLPGDARDPQGLTALVERYLLWMETHHYAAGTVKVRRVNLAHFLRWCLERSISRPHTLTPEMLERFQRHVYYYRQRNGQPLSLSSQSHRLTALRSWFAWLTEQHVLEHDPARDLVLPREEQRCRAIRSRSPKWKRSSRRPTLRRPTACGTEPSWSCSIRRRCAVRNRCGSSTRIWTASAAHSSCVWARGRKIAACPSASTLAWLDKYLAEARPRSARHADSPLLFVSRNGHPLHPNQLSKIVRQYLLGAGIDKPGAAHLFRHTTATLMLDAGADVRHIQALLGHAKLSTTAIYTHVSIAKLREVHERTHPAAPVPPAGRTAPSGDRPCGRGRRPRVGPGGVSRRAGQPRAEVARPTRFVGRAALPGRQRKSLLPVPVIDYNQGQFFDM